MADRPILSPISLPHHVVSFDVDAFDNLIRSQGVKFRHYRAMRCPLGMTDMYDMRRPHDKHTGCSNGFVYEYAGTITCSFMGNTDKNHQADIGQMFGAQVNVSAPRFYDDKPEEPVYVAPFDRLYLDEENISVVNWQLFEHSLTGTDKMRYPVVYVEALMDSHSRKYQLGDFQIQNGMIVWGSERPGINTDATKGDICSIRYRYRPYWYVSQLGHEVRVTQTENPVTGEREVHRVGQSFQLQREYVFEKDASDPDSPDANPRQIRQPGDVNFGAR